MLAAWQRTMIALAVLSGMLLPVWGAVGDDLSWWKNPVQSSHAARLPKTIVDVNTGSLEELMRVPGMTRVWAVRIVRFRPYSNKFSIKLEGVLPGDVYERLKPFLVAHREK